MQQSTGNKKMIEYHTDKVSPSLGSDFVTYSNTGGGTLFGGYL